MDSRAPGHAGKKSLHCFGNHSPHGNRGSQYGCDFQCRCRAFRINGTRLRVPHSSVWVVQLQVFVQVPYSSVWVVQLQVFVRVPHSSVWVVQLQVFVRVPHSSVWWWCSCRYLCGSHSGTTRTDVNRG
ncbi:unnamed protein product [Staurois parvus]|uniref:Uncharacterized protein n=1 Tax=Staurois parvus TaxID=386267 RepID=A0ABN9D7E8_9NEOB|nr:unnamed protein product [Staurois parvus]